MHALNPEGIEIASIQGVSQDSVEIYDGDTLIGYGAYNAETHNKPITLSSGVHTIKVKFNGMTKEQIIALDPDETRNIMFTFERRVWDFLTFSNGIGHVREERYFSHKMLSAYEAEFLYDPPYPLKFIHTNVGLHTEPWQNKSVSGTLYGDVTITSNIMDIDLGVIDPWSDADSWDLGMHWGYYIAEIEEFISSPPSFTNWYTQNEPTSNVGGNASFTPIGDLQFFIANTPDYKINTVSIHSLRGINIVIYRNWWNDFYVYDSRGGGYHKAYYEIFTHDKVHISSVPYDILGTGIKDGIPGAPTVPLDKQPFTKDITVVAEPINVANGNMVTTVTDISIPARELTLELSRTYNSQDDFQGSFGYGWRSNFDITLTEQPDNSVIEVDETGVYTIYTKNPDGSYTPSAGKYAILTKNLDGTFVLLRKHGAKLYFNSSGLLTKIEDRNANTITITRNSSGVIQEVSDSSGRKLLFISNSEGKTTQVTDPKGRVFKYAYNSSGNLIKATNPLNRETAYIYDADHNLITQTDSNNHSLCFEYDPDDRAYHSWQDNHNNEVTLSFDPLHKTTTTTDSLGTTTHYEYNEYGLVTKITDSQANTQLSNWDANLNKTSTTNQNGFATLFNYDLRGNLLTIKDHLSNITTFTYEPDFDFVSSVTDGLGNTTEYSYDARGNLVQVKDSLNNITAYSYDAQGQLLQAKDANNNITNFSYDTYGNLIQIIDSLNNPTDFTYDILGNAIQVKDAQGNTTHFTYGLLNRLIKITYPDTSQAAYTYDAVGNLISFTDQNNNAAAYAYDAVNRLTQVTDALGGITQYTYDTEGNRTAITDANSHATQYFYDSLNRLIKILDPLNNQTLFTYDPAGNLVSKTDPDGNTINYTYDALNRLVKKQYPDSTEQTFTYDTRGNMLTAGNPSISYSFTYNPLGQLLKVIDSNSQALTYAYDPVGNRIQMTTPEEKTITYNYDPLNRLSSLIDIYGQANAYTYDSLGRRLNTILPNQATASYAYDGLSNLLNLANKAQAGEIISSYTYEYDKARNRITKTEPDLKTSYAYDALYRLTQSTPVKLKDNGEEKEEKNQLEAYTYDGLGNRLTLAKDAYAYNAGNQLLSTEKHSYEYDQNGNLIKKTETDEDSEPKTTTYTYDFENRLTQALIQEDDETKTIAFKYDPLGRRIEKSITKQEEGETESETITYVYDNEDIILEYITKQEDNKTKEEIIRYTHGPGIDEPISIEQDNQIYYYHYDGLGSVTSLTDQNQKTVETYSYDSFGNLKHQGNKTKNRFTYTGREYDKETGLYYYRNRYYDPKIGRFLTQDPIGMIDGPNLYVYAKNNPINAVDPWGLLGEKEVREQLDQYFGNKLTEDEKQKIARFTGKQIKPWHLPNLLSGDSEAFKKLEQRVREALKKADSETQEIFKKLEKLREERNEKKRK